MWEFKAIAAEEKKYYFGSKKYTQNFCFPGGTPLYSPLEKYPDNIGLGINEAYQLIYEWLKDYIMVATDTTGAAKKAGWFPELIQNLG